VFFDGYSNSKEERSLDFFLTRNIGLTQLKLQPEIDQYAHNCQDVESLICKLLAELSLTGLFCCAWAALQHWKQLSLSI
jgi:hypothetical protein